MEILIHKDQRKSQRISVKIMLLGAIEGRQIEMQSEYISLDGMFLSSKEFVRPSTGFFARIWVSSEAEPLQVYLTSCFIEQTWTGYGIGVYISGISAADRAGWEAFYHRCAAARFKQLRSLVEPEKVLRNRRIVVVQGALGPLAIQALRKQDLAVSQSPSVEQAIELAQQEHVNTIVSDLRRPGADGLALCCGINSIHLPTRTLLLTDSATPKEFLLGLFAGATRVIAKSCSNDMLVTRIRDVMHQPIQRLRSISASGRREADPANVEWFPPSPEAVWNASAETIDNARAA